MSVLIVEDEYIISQDIKEIVLKSGIRQVCIASNYDQAIDAIQKEKTDLVFCDINLNDIKTGIDFANYCNKEYPHVEFIFISALSDTQTVQMSTETSPLNYIVKPFNDEQLEVALNLAYFRIKTNKNNTIPEIQNLSDTELKILNYIRQGMSSREIAEALYLSVKTIRNHRYNITKKLNIPPEKNNLMKWVIANMSSY